MTQCSTSKIGDAPLYNSCSLPIQVMTTGPLPEPSKCNRWIATNNRDVPRVMKTKFPATVMVFGVVSREGHIIPPHIFEVDLKVNTKVYLDVLKSVVILWCNQVVGGRLWVWQQDSAPAHKSPKRPRLGFRRSVSFFHCPLLPRPEPAVQLRLVIHREHHQHDLPQHHPPSIRRAPTGTCGKGMLSVPDPYRGGDWGWRRLHWIDVSFTT